MTTVGVLVMRYANHIPLHLAARKWSCGRGRPSGDRAFSTPDRMRFYCLTQYLHWLGCEFDPSGARQPKTYATKVCIHARKCPACGATMVNEKQRFACSAVCSWQLRKRAS